MKKKFAITQNVEQSNALVDSLINTPTGIPGMGLVFGRQGLGKTQWAMKCSIERQAIYVQLKAMSTPRWFLSELVSELGVTPKYTTQDLFRQAIEALTSAENTKRLLIIDEIDECDNKNVLLTIKDLYDHTFFPILLVGMHEAQKKIRQFPHVYGRIQQIYEYKKYSAIHIKEIADQLCEVEIDIEVAKWLENISGKTLRKVIIVLYTIEKKAKGNNIQSVNYKHLKQMRLVK